MSSHPVLEVPARLTGIDLSQGDLMVLLRDGTQARHDAVEAKDLFKAPFEPGFTKDGYRALLGVFRRAYLAVERQILPWIDDDLFIDLREGPSYAALIDRDFQALGGTPAGADTPLRAGDQPAPATAAGALGARYVLEGSMMGGMHLRKVLRKSFGEAFVEGLAFHGRHLSGTDIKRLRARMSAALDAVPLSARGHAMAGAHWAFDCFDAAHDA
ncbi:MAG: biliverdin-producing heme oxygenase [Alphaproteobacteria bacterium]